MAAAQGDDELNLVPFVDLFSVLICFLLMTAVWMNMDSLPTDLNQATSGEQESKEAPVTLAVTILTKEIQMQEGGEVKKLPLVVDEFGRPQLDEFHRVLDQWRATYPSRKDVTLNSDNRVMYQTMISVFDTLVGQGFSEVGVNTQ